MPSSGRRTSRRNAGVRPPASWPRSLVRTSAHHLDYPGRSEHLNQVVAYLERTSRLKYRRDDIELISEFLGQMPERRRLLEKTLTRGLKQHPESALLNFRGGLLEIEKGHFAARGGKARTYLEKALALAQASSLPSETILLDPIRERAHAAQ